MTIEIGVLIAVGGLLLSFFGYQLNKQKEVKADTRQDGEIKAQLGYISKGVDDIRIEQRASDRRMEALGERVAKVEESSKQAHKRIDKIEDENQ